MPSIRNSYYRLRKNLSRRSVLKCLEEHKLKDVVFYDLEKLEKPVVLRNEVLKPVINPSDGSKHCEVCGSILLPGFNFCPTCSQKCK